MSDAVLEHPASQAYLTLLQGVINRFAASSSNCKTWCVTLVSAIVLYSADKKLPDGLTIALLPAVFFFFLDAYYLSMERDAIAIYTGFVKNPTKAGLFKIPMPNSRLHRAGATLCATASFSVFPCYILIAVALHFCSLIPHQG